MRGTRWLILVLIGLILGGVAITYHTQKTIQARNAPPKPETLPETVSARANDWTWSEKRNGVSIVEVNAKNFRQDTSGNSVELEGVTLRLFAKDGKKFDEVKSAKADFNVANGLLFSEGDVEITMGVGTDPEE